MFGQVIKNFGDTYSIQTKHGVLDRNYPTSELMSLPVTIELGIPEFHFFHHDLKPPIHGSANAIRGYYSMRRIQGSDEHLRASTETPFIHGRGSIIHQCGLSTNGVQHMQCGRVQQNANRGERKKMRLFLNELPKLPCNLVWPARP